LEFVQNHIFCFYPALLPICIADPDYRMEANMFSVEHAFSSTKVILVDEGSPELKEDVVFELGEDGAKITQFDERRGEDVTLQLSAEQIKDLISAFHCPEGVFLRGR
jgi:hypothetical protein